MKKLALVSVTVVIITAFVAAAGCTSNVTPSATPTPPNTAIIKNFAFNPATLIINKGTTVTWTNEDSATHTIASDQFTSSGNLNRGDSYRFQFNTTGTYDYVCGIHPTMNGKIVVEE
jgi:plastocyanin